MKNCGPKCRYFYEKNEACISCSLSSDAVIPHHDKHDVWTLIDEDYAIDYRTELSGTQPEYTTSLDEETEDKLRIVLNYIFGSLSLMEILTLTEIMRGRNLQQAANDIGDFLKKNPNEITRFRIFQVRKTILTKLPELEKVLYTNGQRKQLKPRVK